MSKTTAGKPRVNDGSADINGTCRQGTIETTFDHLRALLGEPVDGDKTTAEWHLRFPDGTVATIYDWKTGQTPTGAYAWHIGGHSPKAVELVHGLIGKEMHDRKPHKHLTPDMPVNQ